MTRRFVVVPGESNRLDVEESPSRTSLRLGQGPFHRANARSPFPAIAGQDEERPRDPLRRNVAKRFEACATGVMGARRACGLPKFYSEVSSCEVLEAAFPRRFRDSNS